VAGLSLGACRREGRDAGGNRGTAMGPAPDAASASIASGSGAAHGHASLAPSPLGDAGYQPSRRPACRVMALRGNAWVPARVARGGYDEDGNYEKPRASGDAMTPDRIEPLARGDLLPEWGRIELEPESEITVHATVSTREITLVGPAIADACPDGEEVVRLGRGKVTAVPGAGIRPGAEVWVATPLGVVRFNDARIEIDVPNVDASRLRVAVATGQATFVPAENVVLAYPEAKVAADGGRLSADGGRVDASQRVYPLAPGSVVEVTRPAKPVAAWARDLVATCVRDAKVAENAAARIATETERAKIGELAFEHVRARQLAHASCDCVLATTILAKDMLDPELLRAFSGANSEWKRTLPLPRALSQALPDAH
ncbi:MAG: hypothetical protein ABW133_03500, partial [Polyangiaceae bacterium]